MFGINRKDSEMLVNLYLNIASDGFVYLSLGVPDSHAVYTWLILRGNVALTVVIIDHLVNMLYLIA